MKNIKTAVFSAIGEASMCWEPRPTGVFDSSLATNVGHKLMNEITEPFIGPCFNVLKAIVQADDAYAWSWHCNLAMSFVDEGANHMQGNRAAARFMRMCFDVDTTKFKEYKAFFKEGTGYDAQN